MSVCVSVCALLLSLPLAGCGGEGKETPAAAGNGSEASRSGTAKDAADTARGNPDPAARAQAEQTLDAAKAKLARLQNALTELEATHAEQKQTVPSGQEWREMRNSFSQLRRDTARHAEKLRKMELRLKATKASAEGAVSDGLKKLRAQRKGIEERRDKAYGSYRAAVAEARLKVDDSPVKVELDTCRALKNKWFDVTPDARRGNRSRAKGVINSAMREWLSAKSKRTEICTKVLTQSAAPKGKTPKNYDFSTLQFYILLELYENELDKLNVAVEKKEAVEKEAKLDKIKAALDAVDEQIAQAMQKGGPELEEYLDLTMRIKTVRKIDESLQNKYTGAREITRQVQELRQRQTKELDEAESAIDVAKQELAAAKRRLRSIPR